MMQLAGVTRVELVGIRTDVVKPAANADRFIACEDVVREQRKETQPFAFVMQTVQERAHFIKDIGDEHCGAGIVD